MRLHKILPLFAVFAVLVFGEPHKEITIEECDAYGNELADLINTGKQAEIVQHLDTTELVKKVTKGLDLKDEFITGFQSGFTPSVKKTLSTSLNLYTSARYLRTQQADGIKRVLIRCVSEEGAVNYMAFEVARRAIGTLKWTDVYTYLAADTLSEGSRRMLLPLAAESQKGLLDKLTQSENVLVANMPKISQGTQLLRQGKFAEATSLYNSLPQQVQNERFVLLLRLQATQQSNEDEYLKVITAWEKNYPDDAALNLISIDGDIMRKNYPKAIEHVDALAQTLGGDHYLTFLKGNIQMLAGDYDAARRSARAVLAAEPSIASAWDTLLAVSLQEKKYAETVAILKELEAAHPGADMKPTIAAEAAYEEFRTSQEYKDWASATK